MLWQIGRLPPSFDWPQQQALLQQACTCDPAQGLRLKQRLQVKNAGCPAQPDPVCMLYGHAMQEGSGWVGLHAWHGWDCD